MKEGKKKREYQRLSRQGECGWCVCLSWYMTGRGFGCKIGGDGELDWWGGDAGDGYKRKATQGETAHLHIHRLPYHRYTNS